MRLNMLTRLTMESAGSPAEPITGQILPPDTATSDIVYVMFHGYGNDEHEMVRIIDAVDPSSDYISVQGPIHRQYLGGHAWYDSAGWDNVRIQSQCSAIGDQIVSMLDSSALKGRRKVLVGFSQGGYLSYRILADHPDTFAGAVLFAPSFHDEQPRFAEPTRRPKVFLGYGSLDRQIPEEQKTSIRMALAAFATVEERAYLGMRHDVCDAELTDVHRFLQSLPRL